MPQYGPTGRTSFGSMEQLAAYAKAIGPEAFQAEVDEFVKNMLRESHGLSEEQIRRLTGGGGFTPTLPTTQQAPQAGWPPTEVGGGAMPALMPTFQGAGGGPTEEESYALLMREYGLTREQIDAYRGQGLSFSEIAELMEQQPVGGGEMPTTYPVGSPEWMEERYGRGAGFGTALGTYGRQYLSPFEEYLAGRHQLLDPLYDISTRMGTAGGFGQYLPGGMYSQWAPQYARNPFEMYGLAKSMMGNVFGMTPEQRATTGITAGGQDFGSLLEMALRTSLGKRTAGWMAEQVPGAYQSWVSEYPGWTAEGGEPSFLNYLKQKYNLGQFF